MYHLPCMTNFPMATERNASRVRTKKPPKYMGLKIKFIIIALFRPGMGPKQVFLPSSRKIGPDLKQFRVASSVAGKRSAVFFLSLFQTSREGHRKFLTAGDRLRLYSGRSITATLLLWGCIPSPPEIHVKYPIQTGPALCPQNKNGNKCYNKTS